MTLKTIVITLVVINVVLADALYAAMGGESFLAGMAGNTAEYIVNLFVGAVLLLLN